ncbi:MAG: DUF3365 domain-containing protein, partial [Chloroflexi bacterium]|nr:DUF3365 domain-containing protein [Chloroflexota bacterium]
MSIKYKILIICVPILTMIGLATFAIYTRSAIAANQQEQLSTTRAFFQQIVLTRRWIAQHGGVYVLKGPDVEPNPYLYRIPDLKVDITDDEGQVYTLRNPALVTRELSELAEKQGIFKFHITSLKLINPNNAPDAFETKALNAFEAGETEVWQHEGSAKQRRFRYMAPLYVESACLRCHGFQGYKVGQVRGGISVSIPVHASLNRSLWGLAMGWTLGIALTSLGLYWALHTTIVSPIQRLQAASQTIRAGDYEQPVFATSGDEIGILAHSFETMRANIQQYTGHLQEEVRLRTAELEQSNEEFRLTQFAVDSVMDTVYWMGPNAHFVYVNDAACKALGYSREALLAMSMPDIDPEFSQEVWKSHWQELRQKKSFVFESIHRRKDGSIFPVEIAFNYIQFGDKEYNCAFVRDITEHQQIEKQLKAYSEKLEEMVAERTAGLETAIKEQEAFSYSIAHDLRSPLRGIDGWSHALLEGYGDQLDEQAHEYIRRVRSQAQNMGQLIDDLLALSRLSRHQLRRKPVDLTAMVQTIAARLQEEQPQRPVEFIIQEGLSAQCDAHLLEIALTNLLN